MRDLRYPEKPVISYGRQGETKIAYNGLKFYFRTSFRGNPIFERVEKIDKDLEGRITTEWLGRTTEEWKYSHTERNLNLHHQRENMLDMIEDLAEWYDQESFEVLERLLDTKLKGSPHYRAQQPGTYREQTGPAVMSKEEQSRRFRNVWSTVFRDNISPEEAARRLGYDPDDYMDR